MKFYNLIFKSVIVCFVILLNVESLAQTREIVTLQKDWKFTKGSPGNAATIDFNDTNWQDVIVPHDWAISGPFKVDGDGNTGKLPWKGQGWYRKQLDIPSHYKNNKIYLIFDGVMAFPTIFINGKQAGKWDYGYNSFYLDITAFINFEGKNVLAVHADTRNHDSRWYPGGGLYRKVQLLVVNPIHINIWGTYITTPIVSDTEASVRISTSVQNSTAQTATIKVEQVLLNEKNEVVVTEHKTATLRAQQQQDLEVTLHLKNPERWSTENPVLYKTVTSVYVDDTLVDSDTTSFGIRTIEFTADDGFHLNGKRVQLKGVNLHSDFGPLGVAFNYRAAQRQLEIMKSMGVNAIRNSHNVAAPELLDLCDEMGLLFFNEIFDKYDGKADITETTDFEEFAHRNIRNFIERDRNHPSVFLWSVGNEIGDVQWNIDNGFKKLHTMLNYVNKYDPTRPTTLVNDNWKSAKLRHFEYYDVHSWNYARRYRLARELEPNKSVIISESASTVSTRGFYEFPLPVDKTAFTKTLQVSSYDLHAPYWAEIADDDFMWQQDEPYIAGEFVWTGFDYLGEPTPYNNASVKEMGMNDAQASRSSYFGIVDLVGIPKDRYYLYKSYWKPSEITIHILPHWNWKAREGQKTPVFVYTNGDCAELFINGKPQGRKCKQPASKESVNRFRLMWNDVLYEPGEVKVIAYKNNVAIGEKSIKTTGKPITLKLTPDKITLKADGTDLSYILIEALDEEGNLCPLANNRVEISIKGNGFIAGVGNGNPQSFKPFKSNNINLFYGKAMLILGAGFEKGKTVIKVNSEKLHGDVVKIKTEY